MKAALLNLWKYRFFVVSSIRNELYARFARSKLGGLWMVINPLSQVAIYALILSNVLSAKLPGIENKYAYAIYLMVGLLCWTLFTEVLNQCVNIFIAQANMMKKMSFPRLTLPLIVVGSSFINNTLLFVAIGTVFLMLGHPFGLALLLFAPLALLTIMFALSLGMILGTLNVFCRDIGHVVPVILQVWFWFTPIVYPETIIPEQYRHLLHLNPVYPIVNAYHDVFMYAKFPDFLGIFTILAVSILLLLVGLTLFRKASSEMVDVL